MPDTAVTTQPLSLAAEAGDIDVLVNNAGHSVWGPTEKTTVEDFDSMFASNVRAPHLRVGAFAPAMAASGSGSIIGATTALNRVAEPGEIAEVVAFLASPRPATSPAPSSPLTAAAPPSNPATQPAQSDKENTMATSLLAISVDGSDIARLAQFWADVLDRPVSPGATGSFAAIDTANGLRLMFHQVPEAKTVKNRLHPDLAASDYELETDRLIKLGAVKLNDYEQGSSRWTTFADPEGNEFDLVAATP